MHSQRKKLQINCFCCYSTVRRGLGDGGDKGNLRKISWQFLKNWFPHLLLAIPPARKSSSESSRSGGEKVDKVDFQIVIRGNFFTPYQVSQVQDELACHPGPAAITSAWEKM